ncbi:tRNA pseudouridine(38-40) synthase TruA [bacterium]|nr:tRNA pseudouridine(38-40) synthase TruA [bacterium]
MPKFAIKLVYLGRSFHGWQKQPKLRTVQGELESSLERLFNSRIKAVGASRTDAGVSAEGQVASFSIPRGDFTPKRLSLALESLLPQDIHIADAVVVPDSFSARFSAYGKLYIYTVASHRMPLNPVVQPIRLTNKLNLSLIPKIRRSFIGKHNFSAFSKSSSIEKDGLCLVFHFDIVPRGKLIHFIVIGESFLQYMVRGMVGAALACLEGNILPENISEMLRKGKRLYHFRTLPPEGLLLKKVFYSREELTSVINWLKQAPTVDWRLDEILAGI